MRRGASETGPASSTTPSRSGSSTTGPARRSGGALLLSRADGPPTTHPRTWDDTLPLARNSELLDRCAEILGPDKVQKPCPAASEGKQLLSCYRAAETAAEFIRLDAEYGSGRGPNFPAPPSFPVPRDTLAFEVETSFDSAGASHDWPAEFGDDTVITQSAADAAMDAGLAAAVSEHDEMEAAMVDAAAAVLSGDAPQGGQRASKRVRTQTRPFDHSP